jgi:hypothetical protein
MRILDFLLVAWLFMALIDNDRYPMYDNDRCCVLGREIDSREYFAEVRLEEAYV